jgi:hypothetical protein
MHVRKEERMKRTRIKKKTRVRKVRTRGTWDFVSQRV